MAVGVTIFIFLLVLKPCASLNSSQTTGSPTTTVSVTPSISTITSSSRTTSTQHGMLQSTPRASTTSTVTTSTARTTTETAMHASSTQTSPTTKTATTTRATNTHSPSEQYTSVTSMQAYVTTTNKSDNDTDSSNQTTTPTSISAGISTVSQNATKTTDRMTNLTGILSQSTNLNSNESTTIISSTLLLRTVSIVTPTAATKNPTTEKEKDKGLEKEAKENLGYDRDLVVIFGTMLSLMLVACIGYGIFKCNRWRKNRQFRKGGGSILITTSQF